MPTAGSAEESHGYTMVYLQKDETYKRIVVPHGAGFVLSEIFMADGFPTIIEARTLPKTIFINMGTAYGDAQAVVNKIMQEIGGRKISFGCAYDIPAKEGALITFLKDNHTAQYEAAYGESLYVDGDYAETLNYLQIHAPRYLSKAYAADAWHIVDIRLYDQHENYNAQYRRLMHAIETIGMGYVVSENWNREVERFSKPIGTYGIRLLTFMTPLELKTWLMALEYDLEGKRIVDLDIFYHGKKISWRDVMDDKQYRKRVVGEGFQLPKSIFFAETSDKAQLLEYAMNKLAERLTAEEVEVLRTWESKIDEA